MKYEYGSEYFRGTRHALSKNAKIGIGIGALVLLLIVIFLVVRHRSGGGFPSIYYF